MPCRQCGSWRTVSEREKGKLVCCWLAVSTQFQEGRADSLGFRELGWMTGFEPATSGATVRRSATELHPPYRRQDSSRAVPTPHHARGGNCDLTIRRRSPANGYRLKRSNESRERAPASEPGERRGATGPREGASRGSGGESPRINRQTADCRPRPAGRPAPRPPTRTRDRRGGSWLRT
jgi:hypothetical protein